MFVGGALVSLLLASALALGGRIDGLPAASRDWMPLVGALSFVFLTSNLTLQYGASRLPANVTSVVMLSEVVFAAATSIAFGGARFAPAVLAGGALIVAAALLAAFERGSR
jgi:drug/metabolite transporter (DMT)-like permease